MDGIPAYSRAGPCFSSAPGAWRFRRYAREVALVSLALKTEVAGFGPISTIVECLWYEMAGGIFENREENRKGITWAL